jgi:hypothetical protein
MFTVRKQLYGLKTGPHSMVFKIGHVSTTSKDSGRVMEDNNIYIKVDRENILII